MASAEEKRRCRTVPDRFPSASDQHMVLGRKGMTTPVRVRQSIRQLETKGLTHTQIARELGVSRTTVVEYATRDYSPVPPTGGTASRSLVAGEYARKADEWLEVDRRMPRKQRHTARRVHERLVEECGFEGSYSSVRRWVKRWRQRHRGEAGGPASWNGRRAARRSISARPWPWSPAWNGPCVSWWSRSRART